MSRFKIADDEGFDEGVLRATRGQVEAAREALLSQTAPTDELVHEARKRIKRARALLRLAAGPLSADDRKAIREAYLEHLPARGYHPEPDFVIAELVNDAGVVGAADLARVWVEEHA